MALKLSFIIPCYNVERYIADCLDSIYAQDMPEEGFEVICVDDYSTDDTCSVIENWLQAHPNLKLIRHQRNMRVGIARNDGMKQAKGDYICFVDADDMLPKGVMKKICSVAIENDLDVLLYNNDVDVAGKLIEESVKYIDSTVVSGEEFIEKYLHGNIGKLGSPWAKLFKRSFLLQHSIWYSDLVYSEDTAFTWEAAICANRVKSVSEVGYVYRVNDFSFSSDKKKPFVLFTSSVLYPEVLMDLLDKYEDRVPEMMRKGIVNEMETVVNGFGAEYLGYEEKGRREFHSMIRNHKMRFWKYLHRRQKLAYVFRKARFRTFNAVVEKLFA